MSGSRIRQIVTEEVQKRAVNSAPITPSWNWTALPPSVQLGAEAVAAGDSSAITPDLEALEQLDRYQTVASTNQVIAGRCRRI